MQALTGLFAIVLMLAALAPVLITGGQLIVSFMARNNMGKHLLACLITLAALLAGALAALLLTDAGQRILGAIVLAVPPWVSYWAVKRWVLKEERTPSS
jgi:hypothetical protein